MIKNSMKMKYVGELAGKVFPAYLERFKREHDCDLALELSETRLILHAVV